MLENTFGRMLGYFLAAVFVCGIPYACSVTKGQRVRSSPDIPVTQFTCSDRPPGYYADLETGCQVYHMCTEGGNQFSYKCPNTTLFQQRMLICAHWYQVNCSRSEQHYAANLLIGQKDKPFVNDDPNLSPKEKELKTLQNPDILQNLGQSTRDGSARQAKSQVSSGNTQVNRIFQNNFKRDGESSIGFPGKTNSFGSSFPTTGAPTNSRKTPEDLSSLPLAGSVLPGGLKSFQFPRAPEQSFAFNSKLFQSTPSPQQSSSSRLQFANHAGLARQKVTVANAFGLSTSTPNSIDSVNVFTSPKAPVSFIPKAIKDNTNNFPSGGFKKQRIPEQAFQQNSTGSEPSFDFLPPSKQKQSLDLLVASQENALTSKWSTTPLPNLGTEDSLPDTDFKAVIEQTKNGSLPDDKYNTFIKRFNPYEEAPAPVETTTVKADDVQQEYHTFINRFIPDEVQSATESNLREQQENHVFINRFILTPEEQNSSKDRQQVEKLHALLPPVDQLTVNFPNFDLTPPSDDSDDSESNKIELHLQDPRRAFFIPSEEGNDFTKADAAPIIVTIPLHAHQKSPPMWFRTNESNDPCARCHPSFIVNKNSCMPCVIIR